MPIEDLRVVVATLAAEHPSLAEPLKEIDRALAELDVRRSSSQDLQVRVLQARVRELMDHNPPKADALKACFADATDQLRRKGAEVKQARALALETAGVARLAIAEIRGKGRRGEFETRMIELETRIGGTE